LGLGVGVETLHCKDISWQTERYVKFVSCNFCGTVKGVTMFKLYENKFKTV